MTINFCDPSFQTKNVWKGIICVLHPLRLGWGPQLLGIVTPPEERSTGSLNAYMSNKGELVSFSSFEKGGEWIREDWDMIGVH